MAILGAGVLGIAWVRDWKSLPPAQFLATLVYFWGWYNDFYSADQLLATVLFATVFFLLFAALPLVRSWRDGELSGLEAGLVLLNSLAYLVALRGMLWPDNRWALTAAVLAELQLNGSLSSTQSDQLVELTVERLVAAGVTAVKKVAPKIPPGKASILDWIGWQPTVDGKILPAHSFDPVAPAISAEVPMMIGSCLNEFTMSILNPKLESLTDEDLQTRVAAKYGAGENSAHIIEVFRRGHPGATPVVLWELITNDFRRLAVTQAQRKAAQKAAPVYLYSFAWQSPVLDGRFRSFHCLEIPFVFYNTDVHASMTGGGADARELSAKVSDAWIRFARSGDPNHSGIPKWLRFDANHGATMIFDKVCEARNAPDREELRVMAEVNSKGESLNEVQYS